MPDQHAADHYPPPPLDESGLAEIENRQSWVEHHQEGATSIEQDELVERDVPALVATVRYWIDRAEARLLGNMDLVRTIVDVTAERNKLREENRLTLVNLLWQARKDREQARSAMCSQAMLEEHDKRIEMLQFLRRVYEPTA